MKNSKLLKILGGSGLMLLLLFLFYEKVSPQKKPIPLEQTKREAIIDKNQILSPSIDPMISLTALSIPWQNLKLTVRAVYELQKHEIEDDKVLESFNLVYKDKLLAQILILKEKKAEEIISFFKQKAGSENADLSIEDLKKVNPGLQGELITAKKEGTNNYYLAYFENPKNQNVIVVEVKDTENWLTYPSDFLSILSSVEIL